MNLFLRNGGNTGEADKPRKYEFHFLIFALVIWLI
jgi:hypothetical protein